MNKKSKKIVILTIIVLIALALIFLAIYYIKNESQTMRGVVVEANERSLIMMGVNGGLYYVGFSDEENIGFKQGQEILVHFNGEILAIYPEQFANIQKIEILKEESNVEIPENILRYCYSSKDNVRIKVNELTSDYLKLTIVDTNEFPYKYLGQYSIEKKIKNKDYTGVGYQIGENTGNSTAGFSRNRVGIYMGRSV